MGEGRIRGTCMHKLSQRPDLTNLTPRLHVYMLYRVGGGAMQGQVEARCCCKIVWRIAVIAMAQLSSA